MKDVAYYKECNKENHLFFNFNEKLRNLIRSSTLFLFYLEAYLEQ